jgi:putative FmdB family regulatory protein
VPIYEFYCKKCNTIYKFFSRTINTEKIPNCPKCKDIKLKRNISLFATISGKREDNSADETIPQLDESRLEKALSMLANEADKDIDEDPRRAAMLMRRLSDAAGLKMGPGMEEALRRLEKGEDPEKIEEEMGDILEEEEPFSLETKDRRGSKKTKPKTDDTLYEL